MNLKNLRILSSDESLHDAPLTEPSRQEYFIGLLCKVVEPGSSFCVVTFGCQMNARDSEKLEGIAERIGFSDCAREEDSDVVIFNTCTVRENANEHLYGRLGRLKQIKKSRPDMIIGVCGCMMQEAEEIETLKKKYPYVDIIFGTHNLYTFSELLFMLLRKRHGKAEEIPVLGHESLVDNSAETEKIGKALRINNTREINKLLSRPVISVWKDSRDIVESIPSKRKFDFKQGINIMFGCDNFCTYCIVPYVRGREKSRNPEEIFSEIRKSASEGVKEIMLLGQNVNSYNGGMRFPELLKSVDDLAAETGIERVRFMTSHPKDLSDELIDVMASGRKICRQFHLPLQSGSDKILKRMNRRYSGERFIERALSLKEKMPDISLSTDIIVGFPGETEEDFADTLAVLDAVRFDFAYTFIYSKREGTPAASFPGCVDASTVKDRFERLLKLQNRITAENLSALTGSIRKVLFENVSEFDNDLISGRLSGGASVHVRGTRSLIGTIRDTELTECRGFYFMGKVI